mmetsp:Transcript_56177/g.157651  ORF Transcript_56177/g.157651 Transcript_56177/m.157651 type:complete len:100 (-) Transcript_56177:67-366(-)
MSTDCCASQSSKEGSESSVRESKGGRDSHVGLHDPPRFSVGNEAKDNESSVDADKVGAMPHWTPADIGVGDLAGPKVLSKEVVAMGVDVSAHETRNRIL